MLDQKQIQYGYVCIDEAHDISEQMIVTLLVIKQYIEFFKEDLNS